LKRHFNDMKSKSMENYEQEEIGRLIARFFAHEADEEEIEKLQHWLQESANNRQYFKQVKKIWDVSERDKRQENIDTTAALNKVMSRIAIKSPGNTFWQKWQRIAAIFIIPLIAGNIIWFLVVKKDVDNGRQVYNEAYAAFGTRSALTLADGTKVWLNSGTSLRYPDRFIGRKRLVYLNGEAYFEGNADPSRPFVVSSSSLMITATGTKFCVHDYASKSGSEAILVSGKVRIGKQEKNNKTVFLSDLNPGERLSFDKKTRDFSLEQVDAYKYIAWKDGKLVFRNDPLHNVVERIGQIYNVDIELQGDALQNYRYRATFQDESLEEILRLLKLSSPIDYVELPRVPLADGSFPRKKIIIFPVGGKYIK